MPLASLANAAFTNDNRSSQPGPRRRVGEPAGGYHDILGPFLAPESDEALARCRIFRLGAEPRRLAEALRCLQATIRAG